jgi:hypothetical protein
MNKIFIVLIFAFTLVSCTSTNEEVSLDLNEIGTWRLIEVLADPGDGSGTYQIYP